MKVDSVIFYTNDIEKVIDFYQNKIGLTIEYIHEDRFVSFKLKDGIRLGIKKAKENREVPGSQTVIIAINNIEDKYKEVKEKGIEIYKEITEESWGTEFSFLDPDGNKIEFIFRK